MLPLLLGWTLLPSLLARLAVVSADCECGYSSPVGHGSNGGYLDQQQPQRGQHGQQHYVFTDVLESNFARLGSIEHNTDWVRQAFNLTKERARGQYGEMFAVESVKVKSGVQGQGENDEAGLQLVVGSRLVQGMVPVAEVDTHRLDMHWGTFRASMKLTDIPGTCAAFFWVSCSCCSDGRVAND